MSVGIQTPNGILKVAGLGLSNSMTGATENNDGKAGLVPAPSIADRDKFLKGDGNWAEIEQVNTEEILNYAKNYTDEEIAKAVEEVGNTTSFTGTTTDYEANKEAIEDGTIVYLTDDTLDGELLSTHVLNRVADVEETVDELNESLGLDIKLIDGVPHWSERGADSFSPFKSSGGKAKLVLVGTSNSFNISSIVGAENVGNYTADDFICVPNLDSGLSYSRDTGDHSMWNDCSHHINRTTDDYKVTYDNATGAVSVSTYTLQHVFGVRENKSEWEYISYSWNVSPKVYLAVISA